MVRHGCISSFTKKQCNILKNISLQSKAVKGGMTCSETIYSLELGIIKMHIYMDFLSTYSNSCAEVIGLFAYSREDYLFTCQNMTFGFDAYPPLAIENIDVVD